MDTPSHGKKVIITIDRKRYRCRGCGKTFAEPIADIDDKCDATKRLVAYIEKKSLKTTFSAVAREVGVNEKTVRNVFTDFSANLAKNHVFETPRVLGIDEIHLVRGYRCMITNIEKKTIYDMLPKRNKEDILPYFIKLPNKETIEVVTMDMWRPYKQVVEQVLPGLPIVIDKFHIVKMANSCLEKARKGIRESLGKKERIKLMNDRFTLLKRTRQLTESQKELVSAWSDKFPEIGYAYTAKESFFDIFDSDYSIDEAKGALSAWVGCLDKTVAPYYQELLTALSNWQCEILNGFAHRYTNAYTECANRLVRDKDRIGRGYSFDVIRSLMVYDNAANSEGSTSIRSQIRRQKNIEDGFMKFMLVSSYQNEIEYEMVDKVVTKHYGAHIPTLCAKLERGDFE